MLLIVTAFFCDLYSYIYIYFPKFHIGIIMKRTLRLFFKIKKFIHQALVQRTHFIKVKQLAKKHLRTLHWKFQHGCVLFPGVLGGTWKINKINPFQDEHFCECSWIGGGGKKTPLPKSVTHILQRWNLGQLYLT